MRGGGGAALGGGMALATYKDLCIDATDPEVLGAFWGRVLGLTPESREGGLVRLGGPTPEHTVWVNPVPEPRTVKQRVHLDVDAASVADVVAAGATVLDGDTLPWTLAADPEGGELCVFVREGAITHPLYEVVVDAGTTPADARGIADWWAEVLGAQVDHDEEHGFSGLGSIPGAPFEFLVFGPVPEPKTVKNRVHLDLWGYAEELVAHGATVLRPADETGWAVLADPIGNELCVFAPDA